MKYLITCKYIWFSKSHSNPPFVQPQHSWAPTPSWVAACWADWSRISSRHWQTPGRWWNEWSLNPWPARTSWIRAFFSSKKTKTRWRRDEFDSVWCWNQVHNSSLEILQYHTTCDNQRILGIGFPVATWERCHGGAGFKRASAGNRDIWNFGTPPSKKKKTWGKSQSFRLNYHWSHGKLPMFIHEKTSTPPASNAARTLPNFCVTQTSGLGLDPTSLSRLGFTTRQ